MMDPREMDPYQLLGLPPPPPPQPQANYQQQPPVVVIAPVADEHDDLEQRARDDDVQQLDSADVFACYEHRDIVKGCNEHPGDIVEAAPLAALHLPPATYPLADSIPEDLITNTKLSSLQLEGVLYACQRHQCMLASGQRAGFFIGDGAGVGKGRQISALMLDNYSRGRKRHIWFSISADLIVDARRDLTDLGVYLKVIEGCQQLDKETRVFGLPKDFKEGIIFSTYATLVSAVNKGGAFSTGKHSRLQQLIDWCGGTDFDGCLVFDECHKAKNFVPGKESASTKVAMAVTSIQRLLPNARVVYCSATGVTDIKNMAFMERLGLWGDGTAFKSFEELYDTVRKKGLGVAEMLAMEMKTSGIYVSRGLSFRQTEFFTEEVELTPAQTKVYNTAAHVWNEVKKSLSHALDRTHSTNNRVWSSFWASHQRFFKQLCMAVKVPYIVSETKKAIESGFCVVIGLQTTGEASLEAEMSRTDTSVTGFVSLCREILCRFIKTHFPTVVEGMECAGSEDEWCATAKQMLLDFAKKISLPDSPLDEIIDLLGGPDKVAEMTGRKARVARKNGKPSYELRAADVSGEMDSLNVQERNAFMDGKKLVAIISDAASTGISLHADQRCGNQCRRVHVTMELPWSADKAVQQLGRSHRSNQTSGPIYKLLTTNLGGERRFAAAVARRLQSLGALTKGDRRAATGADLTEFNFDTPYGRQALRSMYNAICVNHIVHGVDVKAVVEENNFLVANTQMKQSLSDLDLLEVASMTSLTKVKDNVAGDVGRFLNRILGLKVQQQNQMFQYFVLCLENQMEMAKREGRYNEGLVDIQASSVQYAAPPKQVFKARCTANNPVKHVVLTVDRGMSWEKAVERLNNHPGKGNGFYLSKRESRRGKLYMLATRKEGSTHLFKIARPNTGVSGFDEEEQDLLHKYKPVPTEDAEEGWKQLYASQYCMHGLGCKAVGTCSVGSRTYELHLLCGGILTIMDTLEIVMMKYASQLQLTKTEMNLRVVRAQLDSGERVLGIRYPQMLIPQVEIFIKETMTSSITSNLSVRIEPPDPVNPKLLSKALAPPVTIKNFFKPVSSPMPQKGKSSDIGQKGKSSVNAQKGKSSVNAQKGKSSSGQNEKTSGKVEDKKQKQQETTRRSSRASLFLQKSNEQAEKQKSDGEADKQKSNGEGDKQKSNGEASGTEKSTKEDDKDQKSTGETFEPNIERKETKMFTEEASGARRPTEDGDTSAELPSTEPTDPVECDEAPSKCMENGDFEDDAELPSMNNNNTSKTSEARGSKRQLPVLEFPASKKRKQENIIGMFSRQVKKQETRSCPICNLQFKATSLNVEINSHIDNCLID